MELVSKSELKKLKEAADRSSIRADKEAPPNKKKELIENLRLSLKDLKKTLSELKSKQFKVRSISFSDLK